MLTEEELLKLKIDELPFSEGLKSLLIDQQLTRLGDVLNFPVKEWMKWKGFDYHSLKELTDHLHQYGLDTFIKY